MWTRVGILRCAAISDLCTNFVGSVDHYDIGSWLGICVRTCFHRAVVETTINGGHKRGIAPREMVR